MGCACASGETRPADSKHGSGGGKSCGAAGISTTVVRKRPVAAANRGVRQKSKEVGHLTWLSSLTGPIEFFLRAVARGLGTLLEVKSGREFCLSPAIATWAAWSAVREGTLTRGRLRWLLTLSALASSCDVVYSSSMVRAVSMKEGCGRSDRGCLVSSCSSMVVMWLRSESKGIS